MSNEVDGDDLLLGLLGGCGDRHFEDDPHLVLAKDNAAYAAGLVKRLTLAREAAGIPVHQVAEDMGLTNDEFEALEAGVMDFTIMDLRVWASALGVAVMFDVKRSYALSERELAVHEAEKSAGESARSRWRQDGRWASPNRRVLESVTR